jgi:hypothetical protein
MSDELAAADPADPRCDYAEGVACFYCYRPTFFFLPMPRWKLGNGVCV